MQTASLGLDLLQALLPSFLAAVMTILALRFLGRLGIGLRAEPSLNGGPHDTDSDRGTTSGPFWLGSALISMPVAVGMLVGVLQLEGLSVPDRYWQWLPYLGLGSALGSGFLWTRRRTWRKIATLAGGTLVAAWLLVPTWENLHPSRSVCIPLLALYLGLVVIIYTHLGGRHRTIEWLSVTLLTSAVLAAATAAIVSLKYAHLSAFAAAALTACLLMVVIQKPTAAALRGYGPCVAVLLGGAAFIASIYPQSPVYELLLVPVAPAAMLCFRGSAGVGAGFRALAARTMPCIVALGAVGLLLVYRFGFESQ